MAAAMAFGLAACGGESSTPSDVVDEEGLKVGWNGANYQVNGNVSDFHVDGKIHDYTASDTNYYLLNNGEDRKSVV